MRTIKTTTISILALGLLAGSAVGVAAQDEASMEAAAVTGRATFVVSEPLVDPVMSDAPGGIRVGDGMVVVHLWDTDDPRLDGEATRTVNFRFDTDFSNGIESEAMVLTPARRLGCLRGPSHQRAGLFSCHAPTIPGTAYNARSAAIAPRQAD